jgi:hypothetical protein
VAGAHDALFFNHVRALRLPLLSLQVHAAWALNRLALSWVCAGAVLHCRLAHLCAREHLRRVCQARQGGGGGARGRQPL